MGEKSIFMWPTSIEIQCYLTELLSSVSISDGGQAIKNAPKKLLHAEISDLAHVLMLFKR